MIETADNYMSRKHFIMEVINNRGCHILKDAQATNRTYAEVDVLQFVKQLRALNKDEEFILKMVI